MPNPTKCKDDHASSALSRTNQNRADTAAKTDPMANPGDNTWNTVSGIRTSRTTHHTGIAAIANRT
jgi:hypothetical protein